MIGFGKLTLGFLYLFSVSGQLVWPNLPNIPGLPSPEKFLQTLLNVPASQLIDLASDFNFDEILSEDVTFVLYNSNDSTTKLDINSDHINAKKPIKLVIHGWQSTGEHDFVKDLAKSYHSIGIDNVVGVDWSPHSKRNYLHAARGAKKVGEIIGQFIMNVIKNNTKLLTDVHLIGHSLGAQVSGFAGKHIQSLTNGAKVGRITALDAAAPLFEFPIIMPNHMRLISEDAEYVDAIHTNVGFMGFLAPFGHADFYVDFGGPIQTGCLQINIFEAFVCSHIKSYNIYNRTITTKNYLATSCGNPLRAIANLCDGNTKVVMGEHVSKKTLGDYFIRIDSKGLPEKKNSGIQNLLDAIPVFG